MPEVRFGATLGDAVIDKIIAYVRSKVSFAKVARAYDLPYYKDRNFRCWFHDDSNPSARVKSRGGTEKYCCYTSCGGGDVIWAVGKLEDIKSVAHIIEFMDDYFGLDLHGHLEEIMGLQSKATDKDKFYVVDRSELVSHESSFIDLVRSIPRQTQARAFGLIEGLWYDLDTIRDDVHAGLNFDVACSRAAAWIMGVQSLTDKLQLMSIQDIEDPFTDENGVVACQR